jgi:O-antigen/teichoic acid export membrane protein
MDTMLVGGASLVGSVFSYLLQFVLGRKLSVSDYGTFNALLSLSTLIGVFAGVFGTSLIKITSELYAKKDEKKLQAFFVKVLNFSLIVGLIFFIGIFTFRGFIPNYINVDDRFLIVLFWCSIGLSFLMPIPNSYLQGMQEFKKFAIFHVISLFNRFLFPTILVFLGFGLRGVFGAAPLAAVVSFFIGFLMLSLNFRDVRKVDVSDDFNKIFSFGASVVLVNFSMMALNNIDLIMVKRYFTDVEAGYYAGVMTLGKILLFGAGAVTVVMFPKITALYADGKRFMGRLKKLLMLLVFVLVTGVFCYQVFPDIITNLFFGNAFENSIKYLPLFSVFVAFYVLIQFLVMFFLAIDKKVVGFLLLPGVLIQYLLLNFFHESLWDVININIGVSILTLVLLSAYFYFTVPKIRRRDIKNFKEVSEELDILPDLPD